MLKRITTATLIAATIAIGLATLPAGADTSSAVVLIDDVIPERLTRGVTHYTVDAPPDLLGLTCTATFEGRNNTSIHPGTTIGVTSAGLPGGQGVLSMFDVEDTVGQVTPGVGSIIVGTVLNITVSPGSDGIASLGGSAIVLTCENPPPATTVPETTTTTSVPHVDTTTTPPPPPPSTSIPKSPPPVIVDCDMILGNDVPDCTLTG